jgi:hypothetical protein
MIDIAKPIHIDEIRGGWLLRREEAEPIATYARRDEAVAVAAGMARAAGGGTIVIRSCEGAVDTLAIAEGAVAELAELSEAERAPDATEQVGPEDNDHVADGGASPSDLQFGSSREYGP